MTHFNLLQISADNQKHPRGRAQMFHFGAASALYTEEQNMYKEDEIVSVWTDIGMTAEGCSECHVSQYGLEYGL